MVDDTVEEEWRPIPGHPGYEASSLGRVRSVDRYIQHKPDKFRPNGRTRFYPGRVLNPIESDHNYLVVMLSKKDRPRRTPLPVHVLVCTTFHGSKPSPKHEVAHWNNDEFDNHADNVRWATSAENKADKLRHGTQPRGARVWNAKLTDADIVEIRRLRAGGMTFQTIADAFAIRISHAYQICAGKKWVHVAETAKSPTKVKGYASL